MTRAAVPDRAVGAAMMAMRANLPRCHHTGSRRDLKMNDRFDLQRFVDAQAPVYPQVLAELGDGRKRSHWMWFIFPQIAGLGHSAMAQRFAIGSRAEADAYLGHAVLG